ncbi:hypothetical protein K443DRAFT_567450 [Laccaria amethystina LaAM-08-1]|uniref:Uncharacterized protein n=1 Tax=Laccaria amethystina LaAM-08-1 TaxID=1095629 RepID=A0A0C9WRW9_9AGAR|nr:hypothetical protein K443DRAFT_567450 [Laccaria amethystina LaAM-08-1]
MVGPLVKGVSGALYQSFFTEEEARCEFEQAKAKGNTKIVGEGQPEFSRVQVEPHPPKDFAVHPAASAPFCVDLEPSPLVSKSSTPTTPLGSSLSHAPFEVTSDWPIVATHHVRQASAMVQPASNSTASSAYDHQPRVSIKAPPWLLTYPIAHDFPSAENLALSPLSRADIPLSPLLLGTSKRPPHRSPSVGGQTPDIFPNASHKPQQELSTTSPRRVVAPSTPQRSYTSPSPRTDTQGQALPNSDWHASQTSISQRRSRVHPNHEVYAHGFMLELDPRSPVVKTTWQPKVPATVNSFSFKRPSSPEVRALSSSMFALQ